MKRTRGVKTGCVKTRGTKTGGAVDACVAITELRLVWCFRRGARAAPRDGARALRPHEMVLPLAFRLLFFSLSCCASVIR